MLQKDFSEKLDKDRWTTWNGVTHEKFMTPFEKINSWGWHDEAEFKEHIIDDK